MFAVKNLPVLSGKNTFQPRPYFAQMGKDKDNHNKSQNTSQTTHQFHLLSPCQILRLKIPSSQCQTSRKWVRTKITRIMPIIFIKSFTLNLLVSFCVQL
ncbi:hypothetical protein C1O63_0907 [Dehalococcoides mccartyi]|nr:hypothetical protein C1O63_0907 [Dehalococcoides mccartyi]